MHPQLTEKKIVCLEFIQALESCHANGWSRWTGACNQQKNDLNMCLRKERVDRTTRNREGAKVQREKIQQAWKDLHAED